MEAEHYGQKGGNCFHGRWGTFLASTKRTGALVTGCVNLYNRWAALMPVICRSMEAKPIAFLFEAIHRTARVKRTWQVTRCEMTAFFRRLLHQVECTRVRCASPWLTALWKVISSTRHPERSIITVRSRLPIKRSRERRNDWRACVRKNGAVFRRSVWTLKRS